jgi:hypothetical protein
LYAALSGASIKTPTTSSLYGGSSVEISFHETNAEARQNVAEKQWRGTAPALDLMRDAGLQATVVRRLHGGYLFHEAVGFGEGPQPGLAL